MRRIVSDVKHRFLARITRVFSFVTTHRKQSVAFGLTVLVGVLLVALPARAVETPDGFFNSILTAVSWMLLKLANICMGLTVFGLKFFIELARYNGFIDAPPVIIGWVMVRDLANMFFIVVLLIIAFGTILGLEQYEWKKMLGKLIMAAIFINFSKLIAQLMIDVAHVFTMTFLNAVSATAGGNLINMFHLNGMLQMVSQDPAVVGATDLRLDLFAGAVLAVVFAAFAMATIFAYLIIMAVRVVVLWVLMILAPLAYILGVLPQGKSYADEYWSEFTKHVLVAPIMVFFLWLSFATLGNGTIAQQIGLNLSATNNIASGIAPSQAVVSPSTSILEVTTWENMANFIIAIAFMLIGIEMVQRLGVRAGGFATSAVSVAKTVATYASGLAAARWTGGKVVEGAKAGAGLVGKGLYEGLAANRVERIKNFAQKQTVEAWRNWRNEGPRMVKIVEQKKAAGDELSEEEKKMGATSIDSEGYLLDEKKKRIAQELEMTEKEAFDKGLVDSADSRGAVQKFFYGRHEALIKSRKLLEKVQNDTKEMETLMDKRVTANPEHWMQQFMGEKQTKAQMKDGVPGVYYQFDARDRVRQGEVEAEKARSAAKTEEGKNKGRRALYAVPRFKDGEWQKDKTLGEQLAAHKEVAERYAAEIEEIQEKARNKFRSSGKGQQQLNAKLQAQINVKADKAEATKMEEAMMTNVVKSGADASKDLQERLNDLQERLNDKNTPEEVKQSLLDEKKSLLAEARENKFHVSDDGHGHVVIEDATSRRIAAEKQAHSEGIKQDRITKEKELEYLKGHHGVEELKEEAELKKEIAVTESQIKARARKYEAQFAGTKKGRKMEASLNKTEQDIKAADDFVKRLKDENLKKAYEMAVEAIKEAAANIKVDPQALTKLAKRNSFVRALAESKLQASEVEALTIQKSTAESEAEGEYVEKGIAGYTTPSSTLVPIAKRYGDALNSLTTQALARALTDNLAFVAKRTKPGGGGLTDQMRAALFGTVNKVNTEAYIDDTLAEIAAQISRLEKGEITDEDEKANAEALKKTWVEDLGVIKGKEGNRIGKSNARNASILQNYAITGGNVDLVKKHLRVSERADENDEEYDVAAKAELGDEYEVFMRDMKSNDTFMKEAASSFKSQALAAGHKQLGGHQQFDSKLGFHRMSTAKEAKGTMQAEMRKRGSKVGYQYHSVGEVNTSNGILEYVDADDYGDTIGQAKKYLEIKAIQDRTRDALMGYKPSENRKLDDDSYGLLGGSQKQIQERFGSTENFLRQVILPQLAKGSKAFALVAQLKFDNVTSQEAEMGKVKLAIDGTGIKANNLVEMIDQVSAALGGNLGSLADEIKAAKEAAEASISDKGTKAAGGKNKSTGSRASGSSMSSDEDIEDDNIGA